MSRGLGCAPYRNGYWSNIYGSRTVRTTVKTAVYGDRKGNLLNATPSCPLDGDLSDAAYFSNINLNQITL